MKTLKQKIEISFAVISYLFTGKYLITNNIL